VESAGKALEALRQSVPDVLLSDIGLPEEDGFALISKVRQLPTERGGKVPALAVSAYVREEDRMRALAAGFQGHVSKPFDPADLLAAIAGLAGRAEPRAVAPGLSARGEKTATAAREEGSPGGALSSRVLIVEDDRDSREGLRELLEVWGHEVEVAEDGAAGMGRAIAIAPRIGWLYSGLRGLAVAQRIREAFGERPIILIALTGYVGSEEKRRARESGFDAHLAKPINADKLSTLLVEAGSPPS
jgi:CheY-like chemotaxis protein